MSETRRDRELIRYLAGELDAEASRRIARRLAEEPELARRYAALRATWSALEPLEDTSSPGASLAPEILARVRRESPAALWGAVPLWVRVGALAALPLGLALGLGLAPAPAESDTVQEDDSSWSSWSTTLESDADGLAAAYYELLVSDEDEGSAGVS